MCLVDHFPCGSLLTQAISCTKFKIHSVYMSSPTAKTFFFFQFFREDQSLLYRPSNSERECAWWTNSLVGQCLHQLSLVQSSRSIQHIKTVPWPKHFFFSYFLGRTSLCFTDQVTQEEIVFGGPTPLWVSTYTSYLLCKVQDPFSVYRQSHGQNICFFNFFREDQSLLHRPSNSGRDCAWWTNSLVGQYLHQLSLVQSSRSIQHIQTVPWPKQFFFLLIFFREDQSVFHRPSNSGSECAWWTISLVGQYSHQLSLVQSSRSIQRI